MLFQPSDIVGAVKKLASAARGSDLSHCQLLNLHAEQLGYQNYVHLARSLEALPEDDFRQVSLTLMRHICAVRLPSLDCDYCDFTALKDNSFSFTSHWVGRDKKGRDVRVASPLVGLITVTRIRELMNETVYVVESWKESLAWRGVWLGRAVLPETLARENFPSFFDR